MSAVFSLEKIAGIRACHNASHGELKIRSSRIPDRRHRNLQSLEEPWVNILSISFAGFSGNGRSNGKVIYSRFLSEDS